jgi:serine-type anaerobic sulfatase-maturating enzyme
MVIILKMTTACNGTCVYCSAYQEKPQHLSVEVARRVLGLTAEYLRDDLRGHVNLILHGGEPLLRSNRFYADFDRLMDEQLGALRPRLSVAMQSNLTLLTPAKAAALKSVLTRPIGTSYDLFGGVRSIRGTQSLDERWYRALRVAREANIDTGVVYVVHQQTVRHTEKVWTFFRNHPGVKTVRFNPLYAEGRGASDEAAELGITAEQWGEFLIRGWRLYERDGFQTSYAPFNEFFAAHVKRQPHLMSCAHKGRCSDTHLGIDPDGSLYNCGRWSDSGQYCYGTVFDSNREAILRSPVRRGLQKRQKALYEGPCRDCPWWVYCHGGCPNDAYLEHGTVEARTKWCAGYLAFFEQCLRPLGEPIGRGEVQ